MKPTSQAVPPSAEQQSATSTATPGAAAPEAEPAPSTPILNTSTNEPASHIFGGIRFEVKSVNTNDSKAPRVLISATNTQKENLKLKIIVPLDPKVIDSNGVASTAYLLDGVVQCNTGYAGCNPPDPNHWSMAYPGVPLDILLTFKSPQDFGGARANVSFNVLLGAEKDDGTIKTTLVPVVLPNVPIAH